jgi:cobaltochelatase CobN
MLRRKRNDRCKKVLAGLVLLTLLLSSLTPISIAAEDSLASSIALDPAQMQLKPEDAAQITTIVKDQYGEVMNGQAISWSSSAPEVAAVDDAGVVTAVAEGTVTISAACCGLEASCEVTIEEIAGAESEVVVEEMADAESEVVEEVATDEELAVDEVIEVIEEIGTDEEMAAEEEIEVLEDYPTNLVVITETSITLPLVEAYHNLVEKRNPPYQFGLKIFTSADLDSNTDIVQQAICNSDALLIQMMSESTLNTFHAIFSNCWDTVWKDGKAPAIFTDGCSDSFAANIVKDLPFGANTNQEDLALLSSYIKNSGADNCERLLLLLAAKYGEGDVTTTEDLTSVGGRGTFAYHPDAAGSGTFSTPEAYYDWYTNRPEYTPTAPWVGIMDYDSNYINGDHDMMTEVLKSLERKGTNVVLIYAPYSTKFESVRSYFYRDLNEDGQPEPIDTFVCPMGFQFDSNTQKTIDLFMELNVPVLTPIYTRDLEKWQDDPAGTSNDVYWNVAMPELDGRIEPVLMGGTTTLGTDELTGAIITKNVAIPDRIERVAGRAANWAKLHKMENQDKKLAILYYNTDSGKDDLGCTTLNVPRSLTEVFKALKNSQYNIDPDGALSTDGQISEEKVFEAMFNKGRNIGGWAPGELAEFVAQDGIIKISLDEYLGWYNQLSGELRAAVEKEWGPAPGGVMVEDGQIIIPGIISGNIFLGPQPMRGWGEDAAKIAHSPDLPPNHQYLAFYFWLQHDFQADAVVHFGCHGTQEWLPGKSVGLSGDDWSDIVLGDIPDIYPYVVNNPGEGTQAKRRGYAVLIDYLTAALANTELYGNLLELHNLAHQYEFTADPANNQSAADAEKLKEKIIKLIELEELDQKLGINMAEMPFEDVLDSAHDYLHAMEEDVTPMGLHTFGVAPQGDAFDKMVQAIINYDPAVRSALEEEIKTNLQNTTQEIDMFLLALDAGYIPPGIGRDPIRDPEAMPTGKNIVSFDPRKTPDKISWEIGKKCADDLLASYYAEHGSYPESVGVVLWAIETMRDGGQGIAMAMRLLGIEPVWDATGKVKSYNITPREDLGRPRIDVVIAASSLFRDTFSNVMTLLDKAIRDLAENTTDSEQDNFIKKHYESLKNEYLEQGVEADEAEFLAASRVFSSMPGTQGNGLSDKMAATDSWDQRADLIETYLNRASYIYGTDKDGEAVYGLAAKDTFVDVLKNVEATIHVIDSTYGALDNDDIAGDLGGLTLAAEYASGQEVNAYIANTRMGLNGARVQTIREFVARELDSRLLNPLYVEAMLKEGYAGSATLADYIGNTFFVAASLDAVSDQDWHNLAATYIFNDAVRSQLDPYCLQSMIGWAMEAARKDIWQASAEDLTILSDVYIQTMVDYGVVCCHHTCKNIVMNEWLAQFSTLDDSLREKFQATLAAATQKDVNIPLQTQSAPTDSQESQSSSDAEDTNPVPETELSDQTDLSPSEESQQPAIQEAVQETAVASRGAGTENSTPQALPAVPTVAAGNFPDYSVPDYSAEETEAQEQDITAELGGKTQKGKAYELSEEGKQKKASGVSIWALGGVAGVMAAVGFGIWKGKKA